MPTQITAKKDLLTPRQALFCKEYVIDFKGKDAAIRAGFSPRAADQQASRMLTVDKIRKEVDRLRREKEKRLEASADFVVRELMRIAKLDIRKAFNKDGSLKDMKRLPEDVARAISGVDIDELFDGRGEDRKMIGYNKKLRLCDKVKALELLGQHFGQFKPKDETNRPELRITLLQIIKEVTETNRGRIDVSTKTEVGKDIPRTADYLDQSCPRDIRIL